jgi:hypothetical protein
LYLHCFEVLDEPIEKLVVSTKLRDFEGYVPGILFAIIFQLFLYFWCSSISF